MSHSKIYTSDRVENAQRRFGSAAEYHCVWVHDCAGWHPVLLTDDQLRVGAERAESNPEDVTRRVRWWEFWR
jgi:hypothetical protein